MINNIPLPWIFTISLIGLCAGSFLNVVIYRLPRMLKQDWQNECRLLLKLAPDSSAPLLNLLIPRSQCPSCHKTLAWFTTIPLLSFVILKGKCLYCRQTIPIRYPAVEIITALLTVWSIWHYGLTWQGLAACVLAGALVTLTCIDFEHQLLPDCITLPLMGSGLALSLNHLFVSPETAILGMLSGYLSLWFVAFVYQLLVKKTGMGNGDFKLLAMLGAWAGWQALPIIVFAASLLGIIIGSILLILSKQHLRQPIAFGPYLAIAGWLAFLYSDSINAWYLQKVLC